MAQKEDLTSCQDQIPLHHKGWSKPTTKSWLWLGNDPPSGKARWPLSLCRGELIAPEHTSLFLGLLLLWAHLCSGQGSQPPTLQGCSLSHLYKQRVSCHHVARAVQGCSPGASRFKFPNENDCRPGKQLWSQGPRHSIIQLCLYDFCFVLHSFPQTWNMFLYSLSISQWS